MADLETELRSLGAASSGAARRSDTEAWDELRDRLATDGMTATLPPTARRSGAARLGMLAAAVIAVSLMIVGLSARRHHIAQRLTVAEGVAVPRVLLEPVPSDFRLTQAFDNIPTRDVDFHLLMLRTTTDPLTVLQLYTSPGTGASMSGADVTAVTVGGREGAIQTTSDTDVNVLWHDDSVTYQLMVSGPRAADRTFVLDVASRVGRTGEGTDTIITPLPDGFEARYSGPVTSLYPGGGWQLNYEGGGGRQLVISSMTGGLSAQALARVNDYDEITVQGLAAYIGVPEAGVGSTDGANLALVIDLPNDTRLSLTAFGLTRDALLAIAEDLRTVDEHTWRDATDGVWQDASPSASSGTAPPVPTTTAASR